MSQNNSFFAGVAWSTIFWVGCWVIGMVANILPGLYRLLLAPPLLIWGMTWTCSKKTRGWCVELVEKKRVM